jgi:hypothetical protein
MLAEFLLMFLLAIILVRVLASIKMATERVVAAMNVDKGRPVVLRRSARIQRRNAERKENAW